MFSLKTRKMLVQLKVIFLLIVFSTNMIIGFACAVGIDMWFKTSHHEETEIMGHEGSHNHDESDKDHKSKEGKDNCCNDQVIESYQVDKSFSQCLAGFNPMFFTTLISSFYDIDVLHTFKSLANVKYFVRSHHPPIPDIRIGIQSFQI